MQRLFPPRFPLAFPLLAFFALLGCQSSDRRRPTISNPPAQRNTAPPNIPTHNPSPQTSLPGNHQVKGPDSRPVARGSPSTPPPLPTQIAPDDMIFSPARSREEEEKEKLIPPPPSLVSLPRDRAVPITRIENATAQATNPGNNTPKAEDSLEPIRRIQQKAAEKYAQIPSMEFRITRRETAYGKQTTQDIIAFRYRKQPSSVHYKWIAGEGQGREILYVQGKYDGKLQILPARTDMPFGLTPSRQSFAPNDPVIRSKSRTDLREPGINEPIVQLGRLIANAERNPTIRARVKYLGKVRMTEYPNPLEAIEETLPPRAEPTCPQGGKRTTYFDASPNAPTAHLPVLIITKDNSGREVEYYLFDRFMLPLRLTDMDFDPDHLWTKR